MTGPTGAAPIPPPPPRTASGDASSRVGGRSVGVLLALILGIALIAAAIVAVLLAVPPPPPDCAPGTDCGGPPPPAEVSAAPTSVPGPPAASAPPAVADAGIRAGTPWRSADLAYEFEYSDWWAVDSSDGSGADLIFQGQGDAELIVSAVPASKSSAQAYADHWFGALRDWAPDIKADPRSRNEILGPEIGFVDGVARTYAGTKTSPQGATSPVAASVLAASDGRTTVAMILIVWDPESASHDTWQQQFVRGRAEILLKTFRWGPVP